MSLKGKTIVFTGKMSTVRTKMKKEAEAAGADVVSAMSAEVDFLVYGKQVAHNATNAKYREAKALGIETINEAEYRKRLGGKHTRAAETTEPDTLASFYEKYSKEELIGFLDAIEDTSYRRSWSKSRLISQLEAHSIEVILKTWRSVELKEGLEKRSLSSSGNKARRLERLLASFSSREATPEEENS